MTYEKRAMALAGIVQAAHLVNSAATTGLVSQDALDASLNSIFVQNPDSIAEVYRGTRDISIGLNILRDMLSGLDIAAHSDLTRYVLSMIALERSLSQNPSVLEQLGNEITAISKARKPEEQAQEFGASQSDQTVSALAALYQTCLSELQPNIKVNGNRFHLQDQGNVQRIRALLLSGIRSAVLWHQLGGRRWQFIFGRSDLKKSVTNLI